MAPHPDPSSLAARKAEVRRTALAARDALDPEARRAASDAIARTLLALPALLGAKLVAGYWPIRSEVDPRPAMTALAERGARLALPHVTPGGLVFREWYPGAALVRGGFGLSEPDPSLPEVAPDALLVPLAAFDRAGRRLGYGRGYYDGAIARLSEGRALLTVGLCFAAQEVPSVPVEPHDRSLSAIVTEAGSLSLEDPHG
ncbi:5-formyltetrahydrofolate cyclo-ligase [Methylobacterium sp. J-076]|uniref:5-formyltetrahydrofolate cyclo-ligase n=1 Tax=Methylobacterium sp. J-076 TaxID=2836655 RepID=UPI001FBBCDB2|nr:5-formyltetrahydrofolate cyclo-ligase [Methylobacterium sp. J-076]MCJ2013359.1 5-formyltetrahydrofolate cyclo-ligase [Methylobacterium sp. J-076]